MLVEEPAVRLFDREVNAPEIAFVLRAWVGLRGVHHHAERGKGRVRRFDAGQVEEAEPERFEHALFSAMEVVALLDRGAQVQSSPRGSERVAPVVARLQFMAAVEPELPHVLDHGVTPDPAPRPIPDVIVDAAVVNQRPAPLVIPAAIPFEPGRILDIASFADQMINR